MIGFCLFLSLEDPSSELQRGEDQRREGVLHPGGSSAGEGRAQLEEHLQSHVRVLAAHQMRHAGHQILLLLELGLSHGGGHGRRRAVRRGRRVVHQQRSDHRQQLLHLPHLGNGNIQYTGHADCIDYVVTSERKLLLWLPTTAFTRLMDTSFQLLHGR